MIIALSKTTVAVLAIFAITSSVSSARDIKTHVPTEITGILSVENGSDVFISTSDFIVADKKFPAKHIGIWPCEEKANGHYQSLIKSTGSGKQVTIRGFFRPITGKAAVGMDVPYAFCLTE
jgi:hypothetical protein